MNLDVEKNGLIDISLEDDFLIDKRLDNSSVDLRLSVAFETQKELLSYAKPRARVGLNDGVQLFGDKELEMCRVETENNSDNVRYSLAWDNAFFTSPGFLELEELSLVNRGFKDPHRASVCGSLENVRSKVVQERNSGLKLDVAAGRRQNTKSILKTKLASPTKMMAMQDSQRQLMKIQRSEAIHGSTSKSQVMQNTASRKEYLKSANATIGQTRFSTAHNKKPPLQEVSRNGKNRTPERLGMGVSRHTDARNAHSISSSLSPLSSTRSIDLSPYRSKDYDPRTVDLTESQEAKDECILEFHSPLPADRRNNANSHRKILQSRPCIKTVSSGRDSQRQNATTATKSPLPANSQLSPQPSSLRMPSEKIGYFDMNSGVATTADDSSFLCSEAHSNCDENSVTNASTSVHTPTNEPKHRSKDVKPKGTPPILLERKAHARNKANIYPENLQMNSSYDDNIKPSDKGHRRRNHHPVMKHTDILVKEEKENMFHAEDIVIELKPKQRSPLPLQVNGSSLRSRPFDSSKKSPITVQKPTRQQGYLTPVGTRKTFSTRISPLKRSAFF